VTGEEHPLGCLLLGGGGSALRSEAQRLGSLGKKVGVFALSSVVHGGKLCGTPIGFTPVPFGP
jgi:hypothetical protein